MKYLILFAFFGLASFFSRESEVLTYSNPQPMSTANIILSNGTDAQDWKIVNDGVMGGISESKITQEKEAVRFQGIVRLEYNGGFASMRKEVKPVLEFIEDPTVRIAVRGDGQTYECRFRMSNSRLSYVHAFETKARQTTTVALPIKDFQPSFRGRKFDVDEVGYLDISSLEELGILIADKQAGPFQIDVLNVSL